MSKPDLGSIIHIKNQWNILAIGNYYVNYQNYQHLMLLTSSDTKRTLMHLLLFTNSAQKELVSICTQRIHNRNWLSLPYILGFNLCILFIYELAKSLLHILIFPRRCLCQNDKLIFQFEDLIRILIGLSLGQRNVYHFTLFSY